MENVVLPFLASYEEDTMIEGYDGESIHACFYALPASCAVVCISHGFTEYTSRYQESIYYLMRAGYSVAICDHRGHGLSHRMVDNLSKVHIDSYDAYIQDYACFVEEVKRRFPNQKRFLLSHSMGGCIASYYLETFPEDFAACVLNAPMLDIVTDLPRPLCRLYGLVCVRMGKGENYLGSQDQDYDGSESFETSCSTSYERWAYFKKTRDENPAYQTCAASIEWMTASLSIVPKVIKRAKKIRIPLLLCQAGCDSMVGPKGQIAFVKRCQKARLFRLPDAKHETLLCDYPTRLAFWNRTLAFLEKNK